MLASLTKVFYLEEKMPMQVFPRAYVTTTTNFTQIDLERRVQGTF
jgi:hypothetical protein